jgi:hypothetical protein
MCVWDYRPPRSRPWEDGARTDDSAGTYEWWYFDAHLADGAKLVVTFMNKDTAEPQKPLSPLLRLDLDLPDASPRRFPGGLGAQAAPDALGLVFPGSRAGRPALGCRADLRTS